MSVKCANSVAFPKGCYKGVSDAQGVLGYLNNVLLLLKWAPSVSVLEGGLTGRVFFTEAINVLHKKD